MRRIASSQDDLFPRPSAKAVVRGWADRVEALEAENAALRQRTEAAEAETGALRMTLDDLLNAVQNHADETECGCPHRPNGGHAGRVVSFGLDLRSAQERAEALSGRPRTAYAAIAEARSRVCEASAKRRAADIAWRDHVDGRVPGVRRCEDCFCAEIGRGQHCAEGTRLRHAARDAAHEVGEELDGLERAESAQP